MKNQFKPGDLVKLKSNAQKMTLKAIATKPSPQGIVSVEDRYVCIWHDGRKKQIAVFHGDVLESSQY
jgi:uncharacterized protein YodC (DUF2158 family)